MHRSYSRQADSRSTDSRSAGSHDAGSPDASTAQAATPIDRTPSPAVAADPAVATGAASQDAAGAVFQDAGAVFQDMDALYAAHHARIFRFLLASLRDPDLAHSLTQDTFVRAWQARASYRGDCAPATWLMRIALNLVRDQTRTGRFRFWKKAAASAVEATEVPLEQRQSSNEDRLIARQELSRVWERLATLSEQQRMVFLLRFSEEMDLGEIVAATGMNLSTVKTHLYRALAAVRRHGDEGAAPHARKETSR